MSALSLVVDRRDCHGCLACEIACKQEHDLPVGPRWLRVKTLPPQVVDGRLRQLYSVAGCIHCAEPPCLPVCPTGAISKRPDGIVLINEDKCTGCGECSRACPLHVIDFDDETGVAGKCDLCVSRLDRGLKPACVSACPARCIYYGEISQIAEHAGAPELIARHRDPGRAHG